MLSPKPPESPARAPNSDKFPLPLCYDVGSPGTPGNTSTTPTYTLCYNPGPGRRGQGAMPHPLATGYPVPGQQTAKGKESVRAAVCCVNCQGREGPTQRPKGL